MENIGKYITSIVLEKNAIKITCNEQSKSLI